MRTTDSTCSFELGPTNDGSRDDRYHRAHRNESDRKKNGEGRVPPTEDDRARKATSEEDEAIDDDCPEEGEAPHVWGGTEVRTRAEGGRTVRRRETREGEERLDIPSA